MVAMKHLRTYLQVGHTKNLAKVRLELQYDTCFGIGDFYVNALVFRHPMLDGDPVFPLGAERQRV